MRRLEVAVLKLARAALNRGEITTNDVRVMMGLPEAPGSVTCPRCLMTSYNEGDVREGYCGNCRDWTSAPPHATD